MNPRVAWHRHSATNMATVKAMDCTDNVQLCMLAFRTLVPRPHSPFVYMNAEEIDACAALYRAITGSGLDGVAVAKCIECGMRRAGECTSDGM